MAAIAFNSGGHEHVVDVAIGPDGRFYVAEWDGARWSWTSFAPPAHESLSGVSPGVAWERSARNRDVLYAFVPSFDQSGSSSMYLHVREGDTWRWDKIHTLSVGRQYDTESDTAIVHRDGRATLYGAAADNRGLLLIPTVSHRQREIVDAGNPDAPTGPALVRPKLLRVAESGTEQLYAFASSTPGGNTGKLLAASNSGTGPWAWHRLGAPHGTAVTSPAGAIAFRRGTTHTIEAFVITADGHLRSCATSGSGWHWFDRGKPPVALYPFAAPAPVAFVDPADGALRVFVFAFGEDRKLYACHLDADRQFRWAALGAPPHGDLDVDAAIGAASALRGSARYVHGFVRASFGRDNPRMYQCQWDGRSWSWHDLGALGLPAQTNPPPPPPPPPPAGQTFYFRLTTHDILGFCSIVQIQASDAASARALAQSYCTNCTVEQVDANATCS